MLRISYATIKVNRRRCLAFNAPITLCNWMVSFLYKLFSSHKLLHVRTSHCMKLQKAMTNIMPKSGKRPESEKPTSSDNSGDATTSEKLIGGVTDNPTPWKEITLFSPISFSTWKKKCREETIILKFNKYNTAWEDNVLVGEGAWYRGTTMLGDIYAPEYQNVVEAFSYCPLTKHQKVPKQPYISRNEL